MTPLLICCSLESGIERSVAAVYLGQSAFLKFHRRLLMPLMTGKRRPTWITDGRCWLWGVLEHSTGGWLGSTVDCWDPAEIRWVVTFPSCWVKNASLFGVVYEMIIIPRRPILEHFAIFVWFMVSPIRVVTIEISNHHCSWVWKNSSQKAAYRCLRHDNCQFWRRHNTQRMPHGVHQKCCLGHM